MIFYKVIIVFICSTMIFCSRDVEVKTEEDLGVKYANRCEVCKVLATELQGRLEETGKVHDVLEIGYSFDDVQPKKKTKYQKSELRLIESLDGVCEKILEYNIHKERKDSTRFAKGMSQTFKTLHGLVDKGVKVDLGIPYELWDKPSAEITHMKTQCESLLEDYEEDIEDWYWNLQGQKDLKVHLCDHHALRNADKSCLYENMNLRGDVSDSKEEDDSIERNEIQDKQPSDEKIKDKASIKNGHVVYHKESIWQNHKNAKPIHASNKRRHFNVKGEKNNEDDWDDSTEYDQKPTGEYGDEGIPTDEDQKLRREDL